MRIEIDLIKTLLEAAIALMAGLWVYLAFWAGTSSARSAIKEAEADERTLKFKDRIFRYALCVVFSLVISIGAGNQSRYNTIEEPDPLTGAGGIQEVNPDVTDKDVHNRIMYYFLISVVPSLLGAYIKFTDIKLSKSNEN